MPGSLPRKFLYISIASSIPPGVRTYLRNLEATSGLKISPGFFVSLESIGIQHFCPDVAVISGCITTFHRMTEISSTVARRYLGGLIRVCSSLQLQRLRYPYRAAVLSRYDNHIQQGSGQIFDPLAKPCPYLLLFTILSTSSCGITSPV